MMKSLFQINAYRLFFNSSVRCAEAVDPVQALFLKYVREYYHKLKENKGALFDIPPDLQKDLDHKYNALATRYFGNMDPSLYEKFPEITYEEPKLDDIDLPKTHPLMKKK